MCNYMRFGGVRCDLPEGWLDEAKTVVANFPKFIDEFEALITGNEILLARSRKPGRWRALEGISHRRRRDRADAPRASGVNYDIRKTDKYGIYSRLNFRVPLGEHGDVFDRYMIRVLEMRESLTILEQALNQISPGPIIDPQGKEPRASSESGRSLCAH